MTQIEIQKNLISWLRAQNLEVENVSTSELPDVSVRWTTPVGCFSSAFTVVLGC